MSHFKSGSMVDNRAYVRANDLTDPSLKMEVFRLNSLTPPDNDHLIRNLKEVQLAFVIYQALIRRQRPWDATTEIVHNYLIEAEWFVPTKRPFSGYYRRPSHPPHVAVQTLICATYCSVIQSLLVSSAMITLSDIDNIHKQCCSEDPSAWTLTPS